jgi:hypothetical protein
MSEISEAVKLTVAEDYVIDLANDVSFHAIGECMSYNYDVFNELDEDEFEKIQNEIYDLANRAIVRIYI